METNPNILTWEIFLTFFPPMKMTLQEFTKKFKILYAKQINLSSVKTLYKNTDIRVKKYNEICKYFYEIVITERYKYLRHFFNNYLQWHDPNTLNWENQNIMKTIGGDKLISLQKNDNSRRLIRNLFYRELLDTTIITNTANNKFSFWEILTNLYNKLVLDGRLFAPSSLELMLTPKSTAQKSTAQKSTAHEINYNAMFYLLQAYQPKASILNPYTIHWILNNLLGGKGKLFTPELSWCSFELAFFESPNWTEYVGIDVIPRVCHIAQSLPTIFDGNVRPITIICSPSECVAKNKKFLKKYKEYFNAVLVCPPYFDMELYKNSTENSSAQSTTTFPTYEKWLDGYWQHTAFLCSHVLMKNGLFGLIANNYKTLHGVTYNLKEDLTALLPSNLRFKEKYFLVNRTSPLRDITKERTETLFIYEKTS